MHLFGAMANALAASNGDDFMQAFDRNMPDYDRIHTEVIQLLQQGDVTSSVQPVRDEGDNKHRAVDLDWYLEVHNPDPAAPVINRRDIVHCRLERLNKQWRVVAMDPISFFAPQNLNPQ